MEVTPVSRLACTFGWERCEKVPPVAQLIEVDLIPKNGSALVRFTHGGLHARTVAPRREGWNHYLGRWALAAVGDAPVGI